MSARGRGLVIFVSSDAAVSAYANWGAYGVSKAAQDHLARTFAAELAPVRFLAVDPGEMDTRMHADALPDADRATLARPEEVAKRIVRVIESPDAIANGARLVASELALEEAA
jgi:NAD(P)-dependent dehydrogenase (short-subunit alcohol dehydrogenase family)